MTSRYVALALALALSGCMTVSQYVANAERNVPWCNHDAPRHWAKAVDEPGMNATIAYGRVFAERGWVNHTSRQYEEGTGGIFGGSKVVQVEEADCRV